MLGKRMRMGMLLLGLGISLFGGKTPEVSAAELTGESFAGFPLYDNHFEGVELDKDTTETIVKRGVATASAYDPRETGVTAIENQGSTNTCWAFSAIAAMECNIIKKGYADASLNLSENHLAYFFYNRTSDAIGYTKGDKNESLGRLWAFNGGSLQGAAISLTTWAGVVEETASEDDANGAYTPKELAANKCYDRDYVVNSTYFYDYDVNTIKQAIADYGAVATGIYIDEQYWDKSSQSYYCPKEGGNHAVAIVGWDDNYDFSANSSLSVKPKKKGAWIAKNSYGTGRTSNGSNLGDGYLYVSYEDASLDEIVAFDMAKKSDAYDNNYQHDGTANSALYYTFNSGVTCASVFQAKAASGYNEQLKAISIDVLSENVSYAIQVYTGMTNKTNPTSGKAAYKVRQTGKLTKTGYQQIVLKKPVTLTAGETYAVVITLTSADGSSVSVACDGTYKNHWIGFTAKVGSGQSLVKSSSIWQDFGAVAGDNVRLKAFTDTTNEKTTYKLSNSSISISKGKKAQLAVNITPSSVKRVITWSSSKKSVATVDADGKVTAKGYGTAVISAKFIAGDQIKTLKCKVSVGPAKVQGLQVKGAKRKMTITWKKQSTATGYIIYYSKKKTSGYKELATITKNTKTKYIKKKMESGTYYVKIRPYLKKGTVKSGGTATGPVKVTVK